MVSLNVHRNRTIITIEKWEFFQGQQTSKRTSECASNKQSERAKNEQNLDEISIVNGICDNIVINNAINKKINLTVFNNNFCQSYFPLNFESMFSKNNFN